MGIQKTAISLAFLLASGAAFAAQVNISTGNVEISFDDQDSYTAEILSYYSGTLHYDTVMPSHSGVGNALVISSNLYNETGGSGYADGGYLNFFLDGIQFSAKANYAITGYRVSFSGVADSFGDGSYSIMGSDGFYERSGTNYTFTSSIIPDFPASGFWGQVDLYAPYESNDDGTASVYGTAYGSIDTITIEAITQPVPEPETYALLLAGLGLVGSVARRRAGR